MNLSYRTRQRLRRFFTVLAVLAVVAVVIWLIWLIWVGRYIVYTRDGAKLDFSLSPTFPSGEVATQPAPTEPPLIIYEDPYDEPDLPIVQTQTSISGYYVELEDLKTDISAVRTKLESLPAGTAVLLDVKNIKGFFHYTTTVGTTTATDIDIAQMDALISWLASSDLYAIARIPALRDWEYGLNHVPDGLPKVGGGGALWWDDTNCYWLDPTSDGTLDYLTRITLELRLLGFDEVVYTDFRFPNTDQIIFEGDKSQALADAAATLAQTCATDRFCVSFTSTDPAFPLPEGNCRLYLQDIPAAQLYDIAQQAVTDDPTLHLMFLTTVNDTRFDDYCVLRPLSTAH